MSATLREQLGGVCRGRRTDLDMTQDALARSIGVSRGYIATIETGRANPTLDVVERLGHSLGVDLLLAPSIAGVAHLRQRDLVHVRCSSAVQRRLTAAGLDCRREVAFSDGRATGWIDLLAYERSRRMLIVVEIKTVLDDVGAVERQVAWYERHARDVAREIGWPSGRSGFGSSRSRPTTSSGRSPPAARPCPWPSRREPERCCRSSARAGPTSNVARRPAAAWPSSTPLRGGRRG